MRPALCVPPTESHGWHGVSPELKKQDNALRQNRRGRTAARGGPKIKEDHLHVTIGIPRGNLLDLGKPFRLAVLLTAEVKGIPYEGKVLEASKGELKTPEFLAINPLKKQSYINGAERPYHHHVAKRREVPASLSKKSVWK